MILIAEDNIINQKVLKMQLEKLGFITDIANNGIDVLKKLQTVNTYKLILMDCHMPLMDGFKCTRIIRENEIINKSIPIIIVACTSSMSDNDKQYCIDSGMDMFITKPICVYELQNVLQKAGLNTQKT